MLQDIKLPNTIVEFGNGNFSCCWYVTVGTHISGVKISV